EHSDDVRVIAETRHRLRLALHPGEPLLVETLGLDHGDRDLSLEARVVREEHPLAAALTQEAPDRVASGGQRARDARRPDRGRRRRFPEPDAAPAAELQVTRVRPAALVAGNLGDDRSAARAAESGVVGVLGTAA